MWTQNWKSKGVNLLLRYYDSSVAIEVKVIRFGCFFYTEEYGNNGETKWKIQVIYVF